MEIHYCTDHSLSILKRQLEAYGKSFTAVFSHYHGQRSEAEMADIGNLEVKNDRADGSTAPKLDQLSTRKENSTDKLSDIKDLNENKWSSHLAWVSSVLEPALQLYRRVLPPGDAESGAGPASTRSLVEIATSLHRSTAGMQEWSLGDLTLGLYLLSLRHASEMAVDNIREMLTKKKILLDEPNKKTLYNYRCRFAFLLLCTRAD
eukprot:Gb_24173 [translate_table: standard]